MQESSVCVCVGAHSCPLITHTHTHAPHTHEMNQGKPHLLMSQFPLANHLLEIDRQLLVLVLVVGGVCQSCHFRRVAMKSKPFYTHTHTHHSHRTNHTLKKKDNHKYLTVSPDLHTLSHTQMHITLIAL